MLPAPGVNIPPADSWADAVRQTLELYQAAREVKLVAEKFDIDGTHIGSGGGNHIVLGSGNVNDSPFLRRPDVLASLDAAPLAAAYRGSRMNVTAFRLAPGDPGRFARVLAGLGPISGG